MMDYPQHQSNSDGVIKKERGLGREASHEYKSTQLILSTRLEGARNTMMA
jgi:hypothetical protein